MKMDDWQSLESAPKDGTRVILLRRATFPAGVGVATIRLRVVVGKWYGNSWRMETMSGGKNHTPVHAIGWQPLPKPPAL
jgi:hypothetical protein